MTRLRTRCFTMIEVLVALLLFSMVVMIVVTATSTVMQGYDRLNAHQRHFEQVQLIDRTVESIFPNIVPFAWQDETNTSYTIFHGDGQEVLLTYLHPLNSLEDGALRFARIFREESQLVVYYCERPPFPEYLEDPRLRRSVLATGVREVTFQYADVAGEQLVLVPDWVDLNYTPLGLQMTVFWEDDTVSTWFRRTAGSSYYERWGEWRQDPQR